MRSVRGESPELPPMDEARIVGFRWELQYNGSGTLWAIMQFKDNDPVEMRLDFKSVEATPWEMREIIEADGRYVGEFPATGSN